MAEQVYVLATFVASPGQEQSLDALLRGLLAPTRAETGCIRYDLWQNSENPAEYTLVEQWESEAALDAHLQTPHLQDALSRFDDLLAEPLALKKHTLIG